MYVNSRILFIFVEEIKKKIQTWMYSFWIASRTLNLKFLFTSFYFLFCSILFFAVVIFPRFYDCTTISYLRTVHDVRKRGTTSFQIWLTRSKLVATSVTCTWSVYPTQPQRSLITRWIEFVSINSCPISVTGIIPILCIVTLRFLSILISQFTNNK